MRLILASKSPRRRQLLSDIGLPVRFVNIDIDERVDAGTPLDKVAETVALHKSMAFPTGDIGDDEILITADTIVASGNRRLGKPRNRDEAFEILRLLTQQERTHSVYTGVCLRGHQTTKRFTVATQVRFQMLSDYEIAYYIDTYRPYDKAGAYGIQEWIGMVGITAIEGDYYNVMGLPVSRIYSELRQLPGFALP